VSLIEVSQLLGNFGEFFGAVAVVATLAYLASQLRQNTKARRSSTYEVHANSGTAINDFFGRHADALVAVIRGDMAAVALALFFESSSPRFAFARAAAVSVFWSNVFLQLECSSNSFPVHSSLPPSKEIVSRDSQL
jgi:hypothetical protein